MKPLSPSAQALLRAVLAPETNPPAIAHWLAATDIERLEAGQFQLVPLLYQQMQRLANDHPWLPRLKGIYRRTWVANQLALQAAHAALEALAAAGLPALLAGPAALSLTVYADPATRPIGVAQVLTSTSARLAAIQALTAAGWQPSPGVATLAATRYERWQVGHLFVKPHTTTEPLQVRLCWHGLAQAPLPAWSTQWFDRAAPLANPSTAVRTLDPTDQLLFSLAAGPALDLIPLVDGQRLITQHAIDWPRFAGLAAESRLTLMLTERLALIQQLGALQLPERLLTELQHADPPDCAITAWRLDQINPWERSPWQRWQLSYARFRQQAAAQGVIPHPGHFYDYLRTQWATDSLAATLSHALGRIAAPPPLPHGH